MLKVLSLPNDLRIVSLKKKLLESRIYLLVGFFLSAMALVPAILASNKYGISYADFMRDPVFLLKGELYIGWFSQLGCMLWFVAVGFCFLSAKLIPKDHPIPMLKSFLIYSCCLTAALGADDIFLLHDEILPYFGVKENLIMLVYLLGVTFLLLIYFKVILKTQYIVLGLAFFFLGLSMSLDRLPGQKIFAPGQWQSVLYEDGAKFIGIVLWMVYFYSVGKLSLKNRTA